MKRLDILLVELGLAPSRSKAQALIDAGEVSLENAGQWIPATHSSQNAGHLDATRIRVASNSSQLRYVSRGGLKLESALQHLKISPKGKTILDVGLSTGGFCDCLLQYGAARVIGIDVGHGQLAQKLSTDPRVQSIEGLNVRDLAAKVELSARIQSEVDLCVIDVSFISLEQVIPPLSAALRKGAELLALVKPQFEVGPRHLEPSLFPEVQEQTLRLMAKCGFSVRDYFPSGVKGQDGTQEFFVFAIRD